MSWLWNNQKTGKYTTSESRSDSVSWFWSCSSFEIGSPISWTSYLLPFLSFHLNVEEPPPTPTSRRINSPLPTKSQSNAPSPTKTDVRIPNDEDNNNHNKITNNNRDTSRLGFEKFTFEKARKLLEEKTLNTSDGTFLEFNPFRSWIDSFFPLDKIFSRIPPGNRCKQLWSPEW